MKQLKLIPDLIEQKEFGGSLLRKGKRKIARPFNAKYPMHLVLKIDRKLDAKFEYEPDGNQKDKDNYKRKAYRASLTYNLGYCLYYLEKFADQFEIQLFQKAVVSNHIHLLIKSKDRESYNRFIRAFSGSVSKTLKVKWLYRPYSKTLTWGRQFENARKYVVQNELEAFGVVPYGARKKQF